MLIVYGCYLERSNGDGTKCNIIEVMQLEKKMFHWIYFIFLLLINRQCKTFSYLDLENGSNNNSINQFNLLHNPKAFTIGAILSELKHIKSFTNVIILNDFEFKF